MPDDPSDGASGSRDVVIAYGVAPDRASVEVVRQRDDTLELGTVRPLREGAPIHGEVVKLTPRADCPIAFDVEVQLPAPKDSKPASAAAAPGRKGPAQVATERYRERWDAIWKRPSKDAPN